MRHNFRTKLLKAASLMIGFFFLNSVPLLAQDASIALQSIRIDTYNLKSYGATEDLAYSGLVEKISDKLEKRDSENFELKPSKDLKKISIGFSNGSDKKIKLKVVIKKNNNYSAIIQPPQKPKSKKKKS